MRRKARIKNFKQWEKDAKEKFKKTVERNGIIVFLKFVLPFILAGTISFFIYLLGPDTYIKLLKLLGVYMFTPIGSGIGVPFSYGIGIDPVLALIFMLTVDALSSLFIIWNFDYLKIAPFIGGIAKKTEESAIKIREKYPWIKRLEFIGVAIFVFLPIYGTGVIVGSIIGELMEMGHFKTWIAVMLGAAIRLGVLTAIMNGLLTMA